MVKITYRLNEKELLDFNMFRATRKNVNTVPRAILISCAYLAVLLVIGYFCKFPWYAYLIMVGLACALFCGLMLFLRHRMKRSVQVLLFRQSREDLMPQTTITLEESYMEVYTISRTTEVEYSDVLRVEKTKQFLYILLTQHGEIGIPLRAFDDDTLQMFTSCLKEKTPKAMHLGI